MAQGHAEQHLHRQAGLDGGVAVVWLTPTGFTIGLIESLLYGWYAALLFGGLYNALAARGRPA